jgi:hypothetical protein
MIKNRPVETYLSLLIVTVVGAGASLLILHVANGMDVETFAGVAYPIGSIR